MKHLSTVLLCLLSVYAKADLVVVSDHGGRATGIPTEAGFRAQGEAFAKAQVPGTFIPTRPAQSFPIGSYLSVGLVSRQQHHLNVSHPFFIIGDDEASMHWLMANKPVLQKLGATGIAVNVESKSALDVMVQSAHPISISAVSIDELAHQFSLTHYPVLITRKEIIQ